MIFLSGRFLENIQIFLEYSRFVLQRKFLYSYTHTKKTKGTYELIQTVVCAFKVHVSYLYTNTVSWPFNQLASLTFLFFSNSLIAKLSADKPLKLAHSIFEVKYHLKNKTIFFKNLQIVRLKVYIMVQSAIITLSLLLIACM